jgi:hypothetical protein
LHKNLLLFPVDFCSVSDHGFDCSFPGTFTLLFLHFLTDSGFKMTGNALRQNQGFTAFVSPDWATNTEQEKNHDD